MFIINLSPFRSLLRLSLESKLLLLGIQLHVVAYGRWFTGNPVDISRGDVFFLCFLPDHFDNTFKLGVESLKDRTSVSIEPISAIRSVISLRSNSG